jgi:formylglycine-generating enzyme required for sulfatase activity
VAASATRLRRRRLLRVIATASLPLLLVGIFGGVRLAQHAALQDEVDAHVAMVDALMAAATRPHGERERQRGRAFASFDAGDAVLGEAAWKAALAAEAELDSLYIRAMRELEAANRRDADRLDVRALLGDVLEARTLLAEQKHDRLKVEEFLLRLELNDEGGERLARWHAPATLAISTTPAGAQVLLERYERRPDGRLVRAQPRELGVTPLAGIALAPGSYRLSFQAPGRAPVRYPIVAKRGETQQLDLTLPAAAALPADFLYVPAGRFLYGSAGDEDLRRGFYGSVPLHTVHTDAYLIAVHETTYAEWIAFLDALPGDQQAQRTPHGDGATFQAVPGLQRLADGTWQISVMVGAERQTVRAGERLTLAARSTRVTQDWLRLPITGVRWEDGLAYMDWLDRSGRVPGARYCSEFEWERAARGADGRPFPTGDSIEPDEANFDATYAREVAAMAPDEVGSFPASESPQGLQDAMGNVYEFAAPARSSGEKVARGGAFYFGALSGRAMNRNVVGPDFRDGTLGLRVCAAAPEKLLIRSPGS